MGNQHYELPTGLGCPTFPLTIDLNDSKASVRTFYDRNGNPVRILGAGRGYTLTYTNAASGEVLTFKSTGSNRTTVNPDGTQTVTDRGTAGIILFPSGTSTAICETLN